MKRTPTWTFFHAFTYHFKSNQEIYLLTCLQTSLVLLISCFFRQYLPQEQASLETWRIIKPQTICRLGNLMAKAKIYQKKLSMYVAFFNEYTKRLVNSTYSEWLTVIFTSSWWNFKDPSLLYRSIDHGTKTQFKTKLLPHMRYIHLTIPNMN